MCKSKQLKKLSNHLKQVHGINERKELLQQAKESAMDTDDDDDETDDEESNTDETDDDETDDDTESNQESD